MARKSKLDINLANEIVDRMKKGCTLVKELKRNKVGYATWVSFCQVNQITYEVSKGKAPHVYTIEKAFEVKRRANQGEFVSNVCEELGMNYNNFCRFCRRNDITILTKEALTENIKRRKYGQRRKSIEVSQKDIEVIIEKVISGSSLKSELKKAGFSYSTWRDRCLEFKIKPDLKGSKQYSGFTTNIVKQIKNKVQDGQCVADVCLEMKLDLNKLIGFCQSKHLVPPERWKQSWEESKNVKNILTLLAQKLPPSDIANKLSVSSSYVYFIKRNHKKSSAQITK